VDDGGRSCEWRCRLCERFLCGGGFVCILSFSGKCVGFLMSHFVFVSQDEPCGHKWHASDTW